MVRRDLGAAVCRALWEHGRWRAVRTAGVCGLALCYVW